VNNPEILFAGKLLRLAMALEDLNLLSLSIKHFPGNPGGLNDIPEVIMPDDNP